MFRLRWIQVVLQTKVRQAFLQKRTSGFTLLECIIVLTFFTIVSAITIPIGLRLIAWQRLSESTSLLVNRLRVAQSQSEIHTQTSMVVLSPNQPVYTIQTINKIYGYYGFSPEVNYKDGYLQLITGRIAYDMYGNSQVSGYIRLVSGPDEQDIKLYLGGLCETVGVLP